MNNVKFVRAGLELSNSDLLKCAANAIANSGEATKVFGVEVSNLLLGPKKKPAP